MTDVVASFFTSKTGKTTNCAIRLSHVIKEFLGAHLYDPSEVTDFSSGIRTLFVINQPYMCAFEQKVYDLSNYADRIVYVADDYKSQIPRAISNIAEARGIPVYKWTTIPARCTKQGDAVS